MRHKINLLILVRFNAITTHSNVISLTHYFERNMLVVNGDV